MAVEHVLAVLDGDEDSGHGTFAAALEVAGSESAALTLARAVHSAWIARSLEPFLMAPFVMPEAWNAQQFAQDELARLVEFVPAEIPVQTAVLSAPVLAGVRGLIRSGCFDALIADAKLLGRWRLGRELRRHGVTAVPVRPPVDGDRADPGAGARRESPRPAAPFADPPMSWGAT